MSAEAFPLSWPPGFPRTRSPQRSQFGGHTVDAARRRLDREVRLLGGRSLVISTNMPLRLDGELRASARPPDDRGVAIYFQLEKQPRCLACDRWFTVAENVHALALTIAAMRGMDRWGASAIMERIFTGFVALPEPIEAWWAVLGVDPDATLSQIKSAFREAMKVNHPDKGGNTEAAMRITSAYERAVAEVAP